MAADFLSCDGRKVLVHRDEHKTSLLSLVGFMMMALDSHVDKIVAETFGCLLANEQEVSLLQ